MKRFILTLALICCCFVAFSQTAFPKSTLSYVNVPILKVFEESSHYIVAYVNNSDKITYVSIPKIWFKQSSTEKKATIRSLPQKLSPYMTLNFDNGEFTTLSISMPVSKLDSAWGGTFTTNSGLPPEIDPIKVAAGQ